MINKEIADAFKRGKYGSLTPIRMVEKIVKNQIWEFRCDCGSLVQRRKSNVIHGKRNSCGCTWKQRKHGMATIEYVSKNKVKRHPLYHSWVNMRQRCLNPDGQDYRYYGGRGIKICERWNEFTNFLEDMEPTWKPKLTLDRINNDGNYEPSNCRWATRREQSNNRNYNKTISYLGETKTIDEWRKTLPFEIKNRELWRRIFGRKWTFERAFTQPPKK